MSRINMNKWSQEIIDARDRRNLPVLYFPVLKNIPMGVVESVTDSKNMAVAMAEVIKEYPDTIAAITGMDLTADSEAFGAVVKYRDDQAPAVKKHVLKSEADVAGLIVPDIHSGRIDMFTDAVVEAQKLVTDRPVFGGMFGPFSLAANLLEVSNALMMTISEPDTMLELLDKATDWLIARAKEYKAAGASGVFVAEPTAGILSPENLDKFSSKFVKRMVEEVQDDYFYLILHDCGSVVDSVKSMYDTGCKGFHFGNMVDMKAVISQIPADVLVFGNIDPSEDFTLGTPETIRERTLQLLKDMEPYPHFVLSSGCDLAPLVTNENIAAYYEACREYNRLNGCETKLSLEHCLEN